MTSTKLSADLLIKTNQRITTCYTCNFTSTYFSCFSGNFDRSNLTLAMSFNQGLSSLESLRDPAITPIDTLIIRSTPNNRSVSKHLHPTTTHCPPKIGGCASLFGIERDSGNLVLNKERCLCHNNSSSATLPEWSGNSVQAVCS